MMTSRRIIEYLRNYSVCPKRPLTALSVKGVERVVVIPVLAEKTSLFRTLVSISRNPASELCKTLVICVVNNHRPQLCTIRDIQDNLETLNLFKALFSIHPAFPSYPDLQEDDLREIAGSNLRLGCIDASSPGLEIPDRDGGVGTARKIGMDAALELLNGIGPGGGVIFCLDADTLVDKNYLSAVCNHFSVTGDPSAVVAYAHQMPSDPELQAAICGYEIFLRSYVIGLAFAGSPFAFHAIGSTMACTAEGYTSVRGMNRREAAEDFHFLNKIAKIGRVGLIGGTTVFPSSRTSHRVPFGTGRQMNRFLADAQNGYHLYDPSAFMILRSWLECIKTDPDRDPEAILKAASHIHPALFEFLHQNHFEKKWGGIRQNCPDSVHLRQQFHVWFDGLMTLRLIHHLSRSGFPPVAMIDGLRGLLNRMQLTIPCITDIPPEEMDLSVQFRILDALRSRFPTS